MSADAMKIIEAIITLLEAETKSMKAGQLSSITESAERKSRLMLQLSKVGALGISRGKSIAHLQALQNALRSNLRACNENIESIKEIIELHLNIEREMENDGTYTLPIKLTRIT